MSGRIVGEVFDHAPADLRPLDLLVLLSLAESARDRDRTALEEASADALAYRVRSTASSVRNALGRLKARGLIRPVHAKVHRGQCQHWTITQLSDYHREGARWPPLETVNGTADTGSTGRARLHTVVTTPTSTTPADATNAGPHTPSTSPSGGPESVTPR